MAKRFKEQNTDRKPNSLSEIRESVRNNFTEKTDDDLIVSLAERRENARARQVFEWETTRRKTSPQVFGQNAA
jgi:hypothetical protein